jgi:DNA-binding transcriptional LysR family regulator
LTDAGEALHRHATRVLDEVDDAQRELEGMSELAGGRLRVGAFPTAGAALVPSALAALGRRQPAVRVSLREGGTPSQIKRLGSGSVDVAVIGFLPGARGTRDRRLALEHLIDDPLLLAVGRDHPLGRRRSVDLDDLADERWVAASPQANDTMLGAWQWAEWRPRVELIAREWTAKLGLVAAGLGVTLVPGLAADAVRPDIALVRIRGGRPASREVLIATRVGDPPDPVAEFRELLHDAAGDLRADLQRRLARR